VGSSPAERATLNKTSQRTQGEGRRRAVFCFPGSCSELGSSAATPSHTRWRSLMSLSC
jgi:hypothetical protein